MLTIDLTQTLDLTDGSYRVTGSTGSLYLLQDLSNGRTKTMHLADITGALVQPLAWPTNSPRELEHLTPADRKEVEWWANHIEEMISGVRPGHDTPRNQYDPETTSQNERIASKVDELRALNVPASRAALFRKKGLYQQGGAAALIDRRTKKEIGPLDQADARLIEAITTVIAQRVKKSTVKNSVLQFQVTEALVGKYGKEATEEMLPSRATLYRYFSTLERGKYTTEKATTRRSAANRPQRQFGHARRMLPGQEVQVDSTPMDILVSAPGFDTPVRPILTIMIDVATRSIIAATIRLDAARGIDHALLLTQALVPTQNRPDRRDHRALVSALYPEHPLLPEDVRAHAESMRPFIFPRRIMSDNGKDYLSTVFLSACKKFGIDLTHSAIHTPTDKAHVERAFQTINTMFLQRLPGYTGDHVVNRGHKLEEDALLSIDLLNELLDDWIVSVYQNTPHDSLRDPFEPSINYSPNQMYTGAIQYSGAVAVPLSRDDFIDLLPSQFRTIQKDGVHFGNRTFDSPALHPLRQTNFRNTRKDGKYEIKTNPYDTTHIWVRSRDNTWIECGWVEVEAIYAPHFADIAKATREARRREIAARLAERSTIARQHAALTGTPFPEGTTHQAAELTEVPEQDDSDAAADEDTATQASTTSAAVKKFLDFTFED
ncbi:Mu transposase C-terminal domain-containing protein [Marisediminicola sp. LYQ134]|uniref:Mu transposase C-terminal domain-containing protein n=1 Tax=Marisediminicola sp. LYQ134 TaxID=3391061 RepID=UPI003982E968